MLLRKWMPHGRTAVIPPYAEHASHALELCIMVPALDTEVSRTCQNRASFLPVFTGGDSWRHFGDEVLWHSGVRSSMEGLGWKGLLERKRSTPLHFALRGFRFAKCIGVIKLNNLRNQRYLRDRRSSAKRNML